MGMEVAPAMTIGTCAWMEHEWLQNMNEQSKQYFRAARYMDDVLLLYAESTSFDSNKLLRDLSKSECYLPPLKLEDAKEDTFLETTFQIRDNRLQYKLKNDNKPTEETKIWRYAAFDSQASFQQKRSVIDDGMPEESPKDGKRQSDA